MHIGIGTLTLQMAVLIGTLLNTLSQTDHPDQRLTHKLTLTLDQHLTALHLTQDPRTNHLIGHEAFA